MIFLRPQFPGEIREQTVIGCALALGACAAQQTALQSADTPASELEAAAQEKSASNGDKRRERDEDYVSSLERRDVTGSRINRVRRRGEPEEDTTAGKRVETISREEIEMMEQRSSGPVISGEG